MSALAGTKIDVTWQVFNSNLPNTGDAGGRWSDRLYLRNITTGEERNLGTFEQESGLEPGKFYSRTEQITLDPYISGTFEIFAETNIADGYYGTRGVYEESTAIANNKLKSTSNLTISLPTRPDLRVTKINVPTTSVQAGGTASASFEVTNVSPVEAKGRWRDNVYLSLDGTIDANDILIASFDNNSALTGGGKYSYTISNFEIPKYFRDRANIIVRTDAGSTIDEFPQDDNNILVQSFTINSLPPADLVTSNVVGPNQAFAGSTVKVRYKVTNRGSGETDRDSWRDSIWLTRTQGRPSATNNQGGAQDILLGDFTHSGTLQIKNDFNGSNFYEKEVEVRLPDIIEGGQWYLTAWSDAYDDVYEDSFSSNSNQNDANELDSNNYSSSFIEVLLPASPDLRVTSVTTTTPNAIGGQAFNVTWKVENKGNAAITSGSWYDEVYLADAPTLEAATEKWSLGFFERSEQLAAFNGSYEGRLETILSPGAKGKYIIVKTNAGNTVWEGPYSNNNASNIGANVTSTPADFVVTNVKTFTPNYSGDPTLIEWTVRNDGAAVWSGTRYWQDEVWVSRDSVFNASTATWLGAFTQNLPENGFGNGQTYTQRQFVTLPAGIKDDYYIHVFTNKSVIDAFESGGLPSPSGDTNYWSRLDYEISVFENTDNNYNSAKLPVILREADLAISDLTIETAQLGVGVTPKSGDAIEVGWRVTNTGTRQTRESIWKDRVYLSVGKNDNSLDESDIFLGEYTHRGILGVGDSYTRRQEFILPDGISGDFKLIVFTDSNYVTDFSGRYNLGFEFGVSQQYGRVPEFDKEDNNKIFTDLRIDLATPPDLQVTSLTTDQVGIAGQKFNLKYTVTNTGATTPERQSTWKDLVYLSRDNKLDLLADRFLLEIQRNSGLNAGQSYSIDQNIDLPIDVDGSYYVFVVTDPKQSNPRGTVFEGINENNNDKHSSSPLIIQLPPPVDLQVQNVVIPSSTKPGENITVKWTVFNNSNNSISGGWTDAVYLSADDKWDINDRLLDRRNFSGFLAANNSIDGQPNSYDLTLDNILLPGVTPGDYRIIVRTDIFNEVYEGVSGGETNNTRTSPDTFKIDAESLQLNVGKSTTLSKKQERLFKLNLQAGQTIRIKTDANDGSANEIYVGFNEAPTNTKYVTTSRGVIGPDQSAIISDTLQGTYYVLVRGIEGSDSPVSIISEALPFGITDVNTDRGGDSRYVTTTIKGAQFQRGATVKLVRPGIGEFNPVRWEVVDSTTLKAIFDLSNAPHGLYDVKVTNPNGETSIVPYRYLVERAIETDVTVGLGGPNILSPGSVGNYAVSVQSLTNIDTPYVHFSFGIPELGSNPILELPYVKFSSNLAGQPDRNPDGKLNDVPWAEIVSNINRSGQILAPGYVLDLPNAGFTGANFTVEVYPGLQELLKKDPTLLEGIGGEDLAFKFNIVATATAMTRDEFVAEQRREALLLRQAILQDKTATNALKNLAADSNVWANAFLAALEQAGLLRPESSAPPIRENPQVISLMATLATGLLVGPAGQEIRSTGNIVSFFENIRKWYGHDASRIGSNNVPNLEQFNKGLSRKTHSQGFNIYVPFKDARVDLPQGVDVPPPAFGSALTTPSSSSELVSLTGPLGYGNDNTIPTGVDLPYTIRFENPAIAPTSVSKVQLVSKLDSDLDPRTFQLGGLRLGDIQVNIPPGRSSFQGDFDFTATKGFILRVSAGIDLATNTATWLLEAIDPNTGEVIQNPNIGILRPNDINGVGSGFATYTIAPKESVTGTAITSQAKIIFNNSAPIDTNRITNIIDGVAPTAFVNATKITESDYRVVWNATDDNGGSGIKHVTVYVAENGGDFKIWKSQTQEKEGVFNGKAGSTYEFLALATDNSGNKQAPPLGVTTPNDGFAVNLGTIPTVTQTTQPQILPPSSPTQQISTNQLFIQTKAENNTPSVLPTNNKPEFTSVLRPFTASAFATGIQLSHGNVGALAIVTLKDGTVLASGGANRGSLYRHESSQADTSRHATAVTFTSTRFQQNFFTLRSI